MPQTSAHGLTEQMAGPSQQVPLHSHDGRADELHEAAQAEGPHGDQHDLQHPASQHTDQGGAAHAQQGPYY